MAYRPNRDPWEYFRIRTAWPTIIYGRGRKKSPTTKTREKQKK